MADWQNYLIIFREIGVIIRTIYEATVLYTGKTVFAICGWENHAKIIILH
jgi:hypothetical protein